MNLDILYKLQEQLKYSIITGRSLIREDFRLKKAVDDMAALSKLAPVFAQIETQAKSLFECDNPGERTLDILALVDAVLETQSGVYEKSELSDIEAGIGKNCNYSYKMLEPVLTALTTTGSGRWEVLLNARKQDPRIFFDYRVLPKYIGGLGDSYGELAYQISRWMMEDGKMMLEPLKRGFDPMGKSEMCRRLDIIAYLAKEEENDFYLSIIDGEASKDIRKSAIEALGYSDKNIDILLEIAKTGDKASKEKAISALKSFSDTRIDEFFENLAAETNPVPTGWKMSPKSVLTYIMGGECNGIKIMPKYIGNRRIVEIAIATLITDRALLLIGEPGTAKSWLSEHLCAAINGNSTCVIQGTAGTTEEQIRYSWNYAMLIAEGPSDKAIIKSPIFEAMEEGKIARFEEISRCASEVQDALISILSEKRISIPELSKDSAAKKGFSVIATANTRDRGVNDMSAALKRRFNIVVLPSPNTLEEEMNIVKTRIEKLSEGMALLSKVPKAEVIKKVCTIFRELRQGETLDGKQKIKSTANVLSTAEAISLLTNSMSLAGSFGDGEISDADLAAGLQGAIVKEDSKDSKIWEEYLENIMKKRGKEWIGLYNECRALNG